MNKQLLIRSGIVRPPDPYLVQFERRSAPRHGAMATADMAGVGITESVASLQSPTLEDLAHTYRPQSIAEARRILRAKGGDIKRAGEMLTIFREEW